MNRPLYIKTYGCQMNVYDSGRMADALAPLGFHLTAEPAAADMVILNTCHIREKAEDKLFSDLGRLRPLQIERARAGDRMIIAVAGCVAQAQSAEIMRRAPYVDMVFGPQAYHRLPDMVAQLRRPGSQGLVDTDFPAETKFDFLPEETRPRGVSAFLTIQEGCDKFCTFCVVPYTRGAEFSRPVAGVVAEAERLVAAGTRELILLGQNVNAYHGEAPDGTDWGLGRLVRRLAEIPHLARIRYTTSHPRDMDEELIRAHAEVPQLMPFVHLPVQSGSDRILAAMNRGHRAGDYLRLIERFRTAVPDMAFSSDFIVGFPGETAAEFRATLDLAAEVGYASAFSFRYSARPGTPAANLAANLVESAEAAAAHDRLLELQAVLETQQRRFNASAVGGTVPVLFEKPGRHEGQLIGRSPYLQGVHCYASQDLVGTIREVAICGATLNSLEGALPGGVRTRAA